MPEQTPENKPAVKDSFLQLTSELGGFFSDLVSLEHDSNIPGTIESIKKDSEFRGHTVWVLIFSIFIACIGLNQNSTAVIIGAMLISPLMGPIQGMGLGLSTHDLPTLFKSLKNFGVMISIAILTSFIYFKITPITDAQSELLNRIQPNLLDAVIALFGGLAGIVAGSRTEKSNVIPGVSIATALMPPLCTAGYGLAVEQYEYFVGAGYLFLLNTVFICLATFLGTKYMKFPHASYVDKQKQSQVNRMIFVFSILLLAPSAYMFYNVATQSITKQNINRFLENEFKFQNTSYLKADINFREDSATVNVYCLGDYLNREEQDILHSRLNNYDLSKVDLIIHQGGQEKDTLLTKQILETKNLTQETRATLALQIEKLEHKQGLIDSLRSSLAQKDSDTITFNQWATSLKTLFPEIQKIGFAEVFETDFTQKGGKIPTVIIEWEKPKQSKSRRRRTETPNFSDEEERIQNWLKLKTKADTIRILSY